jgi:metal-sulfur cluster biosynthetic enzyme
VTAVGVVRRALASVVDPCSIATGVPISLVDMGLVRDVRLEGDEIVVELRLTSPFCLQVGIIRDAIQQAAAASRELPRVRVEVSTVDDWLPEMIAPAARARLRRLRPVPETTDTTRATTEETA